MRAYGPGHAQPHAGRPESRFGDDDDDSGSSSAESTEEQDDLSRGDSSEDMTSPRQQQQPQQQSQQDPAAFRPWTLPHVDARYGRNSSSTRRQQHGEEKQAEGGMPTVVVHPMMTEPADLSHNPQQQQQGGDVWAIRPRAGSGRMSLGRRRRYDSYVGTLDVNALERLDEEILQSAVVVGAGGEEEGGYNEDDDGADVYGGRTPLPSQPRRRRPRQREEDGVDEEEEDGQLQVSPMRGSSSSPRRQSTRERLCEEDCGRGGTGSQRLSASPRRSVRRQQHEEDDEEEEEQDVLDDYHHHHTTNHARSSNGKKPTAPSSSSSPYPSTLRNHRADSVTRRAPPPDPTFRDPKMGPPQLEADGQIPDSDHRGTRRLSSKWVGGGRRGGGGGGGGGGGEEDGEEDGDGVEWDGQGRPISASPSKGRHRGRESGLSVGWLYSDHGNGSGSGEGSDEPDKRTLLRWLDQRLPRMRDEERIARAAVYLSDAIDTRPVRLRGGGKGALFAYRLHKRGAWVRLMQALAVTQLLLALWEPPRALPNDAMYHDSVGRHARTGAAATALHLLGLEMVLVLLFALDVGLEIFALGFNGFFGCNAPMRVVEGKGRGPALQAKLWGQARFAIVVLFFADVCLSLDQHATAPRFSRPFRPLYLVCLSETLKRWSVLLVHLLVQLRDVALATGILLGLFSLLGLLLFSETGYYASSLRFLNFDDLLNSGVALYVLMTTQNFGALLNPAYAADPSASSPLYFFFFMAFVLVVVLFLAHLALPRVFWVYHSFQRKQAYDSRLLERLALLASFRCLDGAEQKGCVNEAEGEVWNWRGASGSIPRRSAHLTKANTPLYPIPSNHAQPQPPTHNAHTGGWTSPPSAPSCATPAPTSSTSARATRRTATAAPPSTCSGSWRGCTRAGSTPTSFCGRACARWCSRTTTPPSPRWSRG
jgi:hypothetical protein